MSDSRVLASQLEKKNQRGRNKQTGGERKQAKLNAERCAFPGSERDAREKADEQKVG